MKKKFYSLIITALVLIVANVVYAQNALKGTIKDEAGDPVIGASITLKGTTTGVLSDENGKFSLPSGSVKGSEIVVSYIGYESQTIKVSGNNLVISLVQDQKNLEELVVTGYSTTNRKDILGSVISIKSAAIEQTTPVNAFDAIQGRMSGVQISSNGGPGAGSEIRIRGTSTFSGGVTPLYIVDGQQLEDIDNLNPNDIASVEVLKDGASAAIYGSKSANGVVIITTKTGKPGALKLDVDYNRVFSELSSFVPLANTKERFYYENVRSGLAPELSNVDSLSYLYQISNDLKSLLTKTGVRDQINVSLSGGGKTNRFYWNNGFLNEDGIILNSSYNRINSKLKLDMEVNKRINGSSTINLSYEFTKGLNENTVFQQMVERIAYYPIFEPNGSYTPEIAGRQNPVAEALLTTRDRRYFRTQMFNFLEFEILPSLTFKTTLGVNFRLDKNNDFDPTLVQTLPRPATGSESIGLSYDILQENYFRFKKKLKKNNFGALLGMSTQRWNEETSDLVATSFVSDNIQTFNNVAELNIGQTRTDKFRHALVGYFGDVSYDFDGKYLAKATLRMDGSSRFGSNNRYGLFPSGSVGWRISKEDFMKNSGFVNNLLLKASFGSTGNERIGNYESKQLYRPGFFYNGLNGVGSFQLGNDDLGWESTFSTNYGLDATLYKSRINFAIDFWKKVTKDLLYNVPLPEETGFSQSRQNIGSVENRGIDISLGLDNTKLGPVTWNTNFNFTTLKNEVLELADDDGFTTGNYFIQKGQPIGNFFGYKNLGIFSYNQSNAFDDGGVQLTPVFNETGVFQKYTLNGADYTGKVNTMKIGSTVLQAGDVYWEDLDKNFKIDGFDRQILGNGLPKIFGGWSNDFIYKAHNLSILLDYNFGNQIFRNYDQQRNDLNSANETPSPERINNSWLKAGDNKPFASLDRNRTQNRLGPNSQYISKGDYIRARSIRYVYRVPNIILPKKKYIKNASVSASVNNLFTFTNYPGFNPELGSRGQAITPGQDNLRYPNKRDFILGLKLGF